jgi:hypothetical protein
MSASAKPAEPLPTSLTGHSVPEERLALIRPHIAMLAEAALATSNELPLEADAGDYVAVIEREGE